MKKTIIFNWKMNPQSLREAKRLLAYNKQLTTNNKKKTEVIIAVPFVYLSELLSVVGRKLSVKLAAQDVFWEAEGAYTGEVSPQMLKNLGVEYVIIGHSERRQYLGETDEMINRKVLAALKAGLKVVLCIGEPLSVRKKGKRTVEKFLAEQLKKDLFGIKNSKLKIKNLAIAYEPIWALSTTPGRVDIITETALEAIRFIKKLLVTSYKLKVNVLYGGSVNGKNIFDFIKHREIDGALVGGASLKKEEVKKILQQRY